jgi:hypothetical protein
MVADRETRRVLGVSMLGTDDSPRCVLSSLIALGIARRRSLLATRLSARIFAAAL